MEKKENDIRTSKYGWVDLSNLTKTKTGKISWKKSFGKIVNFKYRDIYGEILIKDKNGIYLTVDILNRATDVKIDASDLTHVRLGTCLNIISSDYKYNIGDIVNNCVIIDKYKKETKNTKEKRYICKCLVDGYERDVSEYNLNAGKGCPVCCGAVIMCGVNDIATTNPEVAKLFLNEEETHIYGRMSSKKVLMICPNCHHVELYRISDVSRRDLSCKHCADFASYANKFMINLLYQLFSYKDYKPEYTFEWSKCVPTSFAPNGKLMRYDVYIPMFNMIIENHGDQHYRELGFGKFQSSSEIQENDEAKKKIAIDNGIYYYIEIDCRKSELEYIKNSIMNSELPNVLGFSEDDIDWISCHRYASGSLVVEFARLWNEGNHVIKSVGKIIGVGRNTASRYYYKAKELNLLTS